MVVAAVDDDNVIIIAARDRDLSNPKQGFGRLLLTFCCFVIRAGRNDQRGFAYQQGFCWQRKRNKPEGKGSRALIARGGVPACVRAIDSGFPPAKGVGEILLEKKGSIFHQPEVIQDSWTSIYNMSGSWPNTTQTWVPSIA